MEDERIVALFWERSEVAVAEVAAKYTPYLTAICQRILQDKQDAEECVNDVLSRAWESIPPHRPAVVVLPDSGVDNEPPQGVAGEDLQQARKFLRRLHPQSGFDGNLSREVGEDFVQKPF